MQKIGEVYCPGWIRLDRVRVGLPSSFYIAIVVAPGRGIGIGGKEKEGSNTDEGNGIEREIHTPQRSDIRSTAHLQICNFLSACMTSMGRSAHTM